MNTNFREHVTSTAFNLSLSKAMCLALLCEAQGNPDARVHLNMSTYHALEERGLVKWGFTEGKRTFEGLTVEGRLVAQLLELAGMEIHPLIPRRWGGV